MDAARYPPIGRDRAGARHGADEGIIKRVLQHSDDTLLGVTAIYQKSRRLKEQAAALQLWCDLVEKVAARQGAEGADEIVTMGARHVG